MATVLAVALALVNVLPRWPGLVQVVAVPPLDLAGDLRLLVARSDSYQAFLFGTVVSVAVRTAILGTLLFTLGVVSSLGGGLIRAAGLYLASVVPLAIAAGLDFAGLGAVYAWYAWAGLGLTILVAVVVAPRVVPRGARLRRIPTVLGYILALALLGLLADLTGPGGAVAGIVLSAVLTAFTLDRLVSPAPAGRRRAAVATAALAVALVSGAPPAGVTSGQVASNAVLVIVPGVDTASGLGAAYRLDPEALGFPCDRVFYFSYRGPGEGALPGEAPCPIRLHRPYSPTATQRPLADLVETFGLQVDAIRAESGDAPIVVVTHSQGAVIAWRAVASGRVTGVTHLVALAGFPHSPVGYPPPGENGEGRVGADALRVLAWGSRFLGVGAYDPDEPLAREILASPTGLESVFGQPLPSGVAGAMLFATADLVVAPEGHRVPGAPTATVDVTHTRITESPRAEESVREILEGSPPSGDSVMAAVLDPVFPAFLPPPVDPSSDG